METALTFAGSTRSGTAAVSRSLITSALYRADVERARALLDQYRTVAVEGTLLLDALLLAAQGSTAGALSLLRPLLVAPGRPDTEASLLAAQLHLRAGQLDLAGTYARKTLSATTDSTLTSHAQQVLGEVSLLQGNLSAAAIAFRAGISAQPRASLYLELGKTFLAKGLPDQAIGYGQQALGHEPTRTEAWLLLYRSAARAGWFRYASYCRTRGISLCRSLYSGDANGIACADARPGLVLAEFYLDSGAHGLAQELLTQLLTASSWLRYEAHRLRAQLHIREGRFLAATLDLHQYLTLVPADTHARAQLALCYELSKLRDLRELRDSRT